MQQVERPVVEDCEPPVGDRMNVEFQDVGTGLEASLHGGDRVLEVVGGRQHPGRRAAPRCCLRHIGRDLVTMNQIELSLAVSVLAHDSMELNEILYEVTLKIKIIFNIRLALNICMPTIFNCVSKLPCTTVV